MPRLEAVSCGPGGGAAAASFRGCVCACSRPRPWRRRRGAAPPGTLSRPGREMKQGRQEVDRAGLLSSCEVEGEKAPRKALPSPLFFPRMRFLVGLALGRGHSGRGGASPTLHGRDEEGRARFEGGAPIPPPLLPPPVPPRLTSRCGCFIAMMAAMKKVLSPISETRIMPQDLRKPCRKNEKTVRAARIDDASGKCVPRSPFSHSILTSAARGMAPMAAPGVEGAWRAVVVEWREASARERESSNFLLPQAHARALSQLSLQARWRVRLAGTGGGTRSTRRGRSERDGREARDGRRDEKMNSLSSSHLAFTLSFFRPLTFAGSSVP